MKKTDFKDKELLLYTEDLCFEYGKNSFAVRNVRLHIPKGSIYGFLGRNGSGKTTVIQLLLGLLKPSNGRIYFENKDITTKKLEYLANIGNIIEYPSLYEHLTVEENLLYHATVRNIPSANIEEILDLVDLNEKRTIKVTMLSLGMKQRLGIAVALFHQPQLLILDEPTNGLDPIGIIDLRNLLLKLQKQGKTILFSSHLLSEVNQLCDNIGIIEHGNLLGEYSIKTLNDVYDSIYIIKSDAVEALKAICLTQEWYFKAVSQNEVEINTGSPKAINLLLNEIYKHKVEIESITKKQIQLEDFYLSSLSES